MPTKVLKFDTDVVSVFRGAAWSEDGLTMKISQQLPSQLYEKVDKALTAMGGAWNRKAKAHLFSTDPRPLVEGLIESGEITVDKDGFFETPPGVIKTMFGFSPLPMDDKYRYLEPSAGMGAIARAIVGRGVDARQLVLVEKNKARWEHLCGEFPGLNINADFLELDPDILGKFDGIYMNPPFEVGQDIQHVLHAYKFLAESGILVAVMSEGVFFRDDTKAKDFRMWLSDHGISFVLPKFPRNASAVIRLASCFGIEQVWYTGQRMEQFLSGMKRLPREERMKGYNDVEFIGYDRPLDFLTDGIPVVVELLPDAIPLTYFQHPDRAVYIFGPEDGSVSKALRMYGHHFVMIPSRHCLNLATAVSAVLTHRVTQLGWMPESMVDYQIPTDFASDCELG